MLKFLAPFIVPHVLQKAINLGKSIGYKMQFKNLPSDWINGYAMVDMTKTWHNYGLPIRGVNYFTLGDVQNGISSRFISEDKMYQAWLGGYIFTNDTPIDWNPQSYLKVAEADQKKWLWYYGVPNPKMDFGNLHKIEDLHINGISGQLYSWSGDTQSDVGYKSTNLYNQTMMEGMAYIMNQLNPHLHLEGRHFIPTAIDHPSYKKIILSGYIAIMNIGPKTKSLLYVCMVNPKVNDKNNMKELITKHIDLQDY